MAVPLKYNVRNLRVRATRTVLTVIGVALALMIFIAVRAMAEGLKRAIVRTGSPDNIVLMEPGPVATMEFGALDREVLSVVPDFPFVKRANGVPLVSPEAAAAVWVTRPGSGKDVWMTARGVQPIAFQVHDGVRVVQGQPPQSGGGVVVGKLVAAKLGDVRVGDTLRFGTRDWQVVGIFDGGGTAFDSEIWATLDDLLADLRRDQLSAVTLKVSEPAQVADAVYELNTQSRVVVLAEPEVAYYATLSEQFRQIEILGVLIAIIMAIAAVFGGMNTMFTAVAGRVREIGVLKALGFSRGSIQSSFVFESLLIAVAGGLLGILLGSAVHGRSASAPTVAFTLTVTWRIVAEAVGLALLIGLAGGWAPARLAARLRVVDAVRHV